MMSLRLILPACRGRCLCFRPRLTFHGASSCFIWPILFFILHPPSSTCCDLLRSSISSFFLFFSFISRLIISSDLPPPPNPFTTTTTTIFLPGSSGSANREPKKGNKCFGIHAVLLFFFSLFDIFFFIHLLFFEWLPFVSHYPPSHPSLCVFFFVCLQARF
ncbi:hypothetical protein ASPZODRAFT_277936 [Penicilliopsis zonata CBS 506.65]|uniref:Uncharacterized protein n=1 Tax=Penicilliopsis zonata CBS 506.65 TaxID=1073090 RepID=A0A1L9SUR4_9EURO|nr:hypothetical protein ASPZODRAFT_277936 [Penicilliopsis zonata CBS 506.65]OJJ50861.1 hypothetical protein ASPZODRAFT_277936 [Penicilliopsis zonata CBS 506.65]